MNLDALVRLIQSSDPSSFRSITLDFLKLLGYKHISLTDGPNDAGTDFLVYTMPPNPTPIAFQVSVEKKWQSKLKKDAYKIHNNLDLKNFIFISSRRIPEIEFAPIKNEIWQQYGMNVSKYDSQYIASTFFSHRKTTDVLLYMGIDVSVNEKKEKLPHFDRSDAAYSFVFFGKRVESFREALIESCLLAILAKSVDPLLRNQLEQMAFEYLGLQPGQRRLVTSCFDRMIQNGSLIKTGAGYCLSPEFSNASKAMVALKENQWSELRRRVRNALEQDLNIEDENIESVLHDIMENLGALLLDTAEDTASSVADLHNENSFGRRIKQRLQSFSTSLNSAGIHEISKRNKAIALLSDIVSKSPLANHILAGELFISLSSLKTSELIRALGGESELVIFLDASVAIPMLCNLLYEPARTTSFQSCHHLYQQLKHHGISTVIPLNYIEEVIAHLIIAQRDYAPIVGTDPDLQASDNAFVGHFTYLREQGKVKYFNKYLEGFGLTADISVNDLMKARNRLRPSIQRLYGKYGIGHMHLGRTSAASLRRAQEDVARYIHQLRLSRPSIVLEDDANVIAFLYDQSADAKVAYVLCTWDKLHHAISEAPDACWDAINPTVLGDVLSLANTDGDTEKFLSISAMAQSISDRAAIRGAAVWDKLIRLEKANLHDAELLQVARDFKKKFLEKKRSVPEHEEIARAWSEWKHNQSL